MFNGWGRHLVHWWLQSTWHQDMERRISQLHDLYKEMSTNIVFGSKQNFLWTGNITYEHHQQAKAEFKPFWRRYYSKSSLLLPVWQKNRFCSTIWYAYIFLMIWTTSSSSSSCSCTNVQWISARNLTPSVSVYNLISCWSNAYLANSLRLMLDAGTPYQSAAIFGAVRDEGQKTSKNYLVNSQSKDSIQVIR